MHFDSAIKSLVLADDFVYIRGEYAKFLIGFVHVNPMRGHVDKLPHAPRGLAPVSGWRAELIDSTVVISWRS